MRNALFSGIALLAFAGAAQAQVKISQMPSASALTGPELIPIVQGGTNVTTTPSAFGTYLDGSFLQISNNLSDLNSASTARTNLGLGTAATQNTGTSGATLGLLNGNLTFGGTDIFSSLPTFPSCTANYVLASPNGSSGSPTCRALVAGDLPSGTTPTGANPTGTVGLSAVNGSSSNFMRADAAPPLSQSITPTWTGLHKYTNGDFSILGSSTGYSLIESGLSSSSNQTLTLPTEAADTLVDLTGTQALTNKTINGLTPTALSTGFSLAGGTTSKTLTVSNTLTLAGTDGTTMTFPSSSSTVMTLATPGTINGKLTIGSAGQLAGGSSNAVIIQYTAPSSCVAPTGGTSCSIGNQTGTAAFTITLSGGTPTGTSMSWTMPGATHDWTCDGTDATANLRMQQTAWSSNGVTVSFYSQAGTLTAPGASDVVHMKCSGE